MGGFWDEEAESNLENLIVVDDIDHFEICLLEGITTVLVELAIQTRELKIERTEEVANDRQQQNEGMEKDLEATEACETLSRRRGA